MAVAEMAMAGSCVTSSSQCEWTCCRIEQNRTEHKLNLPRKFSISEWVADGGPEFERTTNSDTMDVY